MSKEYGKPFHARSPLSLPLPRRSVSGKPKRSSSLPASSMSSTKFKLVLLMPSRVTYLPVLRKVPSGLASNKRLMRHSRPLAAWALLAASSRRPSWRLNSSKRSATMSSAGMLAAAPLPPSSKSLTSAAADSGMISELRRAVTLPRAWPPATSSQVI